ncbi:DUF3857 domain-containing protein, partial [Prolixibacteraceae bacterium]|nr:DUF3857 domain-containing protein [Prolixibacteraceae bacterium]
MTKINLVLIIFTLLCSHLTYAKDFPQYNVNLIPSKLKIDAHAVIRYSCTNIEAISQDDLHVTEKNVVTLLDSDGLDLINLSALYSNSSKIKSIKVTTYDPYGKELKKYNKNKFKDKSLSEGNIFATDNRLKTLELHPYTYPITVSFELEYYDKTTAFIPIWFPIRYYGCSIEKSVYTFTNPRLLEYHVSEKKLSSFGIQKTKNENSITYTLEQQPSLSYEAKMPEISILFPQVTITLDDFSYMGVRGSAKNYKELAKWYYESFIDHHFTLSNVMEEKVKELVKGVNEPMDKARILYRYLQNNTRYICVTIDQGGIEPEKAEKVAQLGYGDCKGLSNYMKAMLEVVGIPSYHVLISAGKNKDIDTTKVQLGGNHMILNIPNEGNEIWLECTSTDGAFGFIPKSIRNKHVILAKPEGDVLSKTPQYPDSINILKTEADIYINKEGTADIDYKRTSSDLFYGYYYDLPSYSEKDQKNFYVRDWRHISNIAIESIKYYHDSIDFCFSEILKLKIPNFCTKIGDKNGLSLSKLRSFSAYAPKYRNRKYPLKISNGEVYKMKMTYHLPKGQIIKTTCQRVDLKTQFGTYHREIEVRDAQTVVVEREILLNSGTYPAFDYKAYRQFIEKIKEKDNTIL